MGIELRPVADLIPYIRNPRLHSESQVKQVAASMREFGWVNPVLVDEESTILAGHGRILAAKLLGWLEAPVMVARGWNEAKRRAYVIVDNKLAMNATWETELLDAEIRSLQDELFDVSLLGFSDDELKRLTDDVAEKFYDQMATSPGQSDTGAIADRREAAQAAQGDQVVLSVPLSIAERQLVSDAMTRCRDTYQLATSGAALWKICHLYLQT